MAYVTVNGTSANNFMFFQGIEGFYNNVLTNPYSGRSVTISETKTINNAIYDGRAGSDTLALTENGDVLTLTDSVGTLLIQNIEYFNASAGGDIIILAHNTLSYGNAVLRGADGNDILWSNNGNDIVQAGTGDDDVDTGGGNDYLAGNEGNDYLSGGTGDDTYGIAVGDGIDVISETSGNDTISFGDGISFSMLQFSVIGANLTIDYGSGSLTINNQLAANVSGHVEKILFWDQTTFNLIGFAPNDAPVAADDALSGLRNGVVAGNVLADNGAGADSDVNGGDVLSVVASSFTTAMGGAVVLNADGSFTYTPAANFYGEDSFEYTLEDGHGGTDTGLVSLSIGLDAATAIIGTQDDNVITGTGGNDEIFGLDGNDVLYGDDGLLGGTTLDKTFADGVITDLKEGVNIASLLSSGVPSLGIAGGNLTVDFDATASITFRKGAAGNNNSFGTFAIADDGTITTATMNWAAVKTAGVDVTHQIDLPTDADGGNFGFFVIFNGNSVNNNYTGLDITGEGNISFVYNYGKADARDAKITDPGSRVSTVYSDGVTTKVLSGLTFFSSERGDAANLNIDGKVHVVSGLRDLNNVTLDVKKAELAAKPVSFTKNGITISALTGTLIAEADGKVGIKSAVAGGNIMNGTETLHAGFAGSDKVTITLLEVAGGGSVFNLKIYLDGDTTQPVAYDYVTGTMATGTLNIALDSTMFGGALITGFDVSSATETFWLNNIRADVAGGIDNTQIRIGFEDTNRLGDSDYQDVLFDLDINPVQIGDIEGGNDFLDGGAGNDILYGEGGNDILVIGDGADQAYGGEGVDIFALTKIDGLVDTIHDFNAGQGDSINLSDVLEGYDPLTSDIAAFVQLVQNGANTELLINADGDAGGTFVAAAIIIGHTDSLGTLLGNGAIVADQAALA